MPFDDEPLTLHVEVVVYRESWAVEGRAMCNWLTREMPEAAAIDHIGSTAVPGLAAKDCIDVMVQIPHLDGQFRAEALLARGYRRRPEDWNNEESAWGATCPKQVFAPPPGSRSCNIHIRPAGSLTAMYALLFRDYLRANPAMAAAWGVFKSRLAAHATNLLDYGQLKDPAQEILMLAAKAWAQEVGWPRGWVGDR